MNKTKRLKKLLRQWTRAEIMSRLSTFPNRYASDFFSKKIEIEDEIREFLYGTSDLVALGKKWKLLAEKNPKTVPLSRIEKKRIAKAKKAKKEILEFFS